jgi:hypothetical protein
MKKLLIIIVTALVCGLVFTSCNPEKPVKNGYIKTVFGGCNVEPDTRGEDSESGNDGVIITITENFVNVFVSLAYPCKNAPFETQVEVINDVIHMYIIDLCDPNPDSSCYYRYGRCLCYYTFDFVFERQGTVNQDYKIVLIDPRVENPFIISEGTISPGNASFAGFIFE